VRVSRGSSVNSPSCVDPSCAYWVVRWENLGEGTHQVACWAGTSPEAAGWHDIVTGARTWAASAKYTIVGDSGSAELPCYYGYPGTQVRAVVDAVPHRVSIW
jgi:hypothetical protein